jgi:hypothetical protein
LVAENVADAEGDRLSIAMVPTLLVLDVVPRHSWTAPPEYGEVKPQDFCCPVNVAAPINTALPLEGPLSVTVASEDFP